MLDKQEKSHNKEEKSGTLPQRPFKIKQEITLDRALMNGLLSGEDQFSAFKSGTNAKM